MANEKRSTAPALCMKDFAGTPPGVHIACLTPLQRDDEGRSWCPKHGRVPEEHGNPVGIISTPENRFSDAECQSLLDLINVIHGCSDMGGPVDSYIQNDEQRAVLAKLRFGVLKI